MNSKQEDEMMEASKITVMRHDCITITVIHLHSADNDGPEIKWKTTTSSGKSPNCQSNSNKPEWINTAKFHTSKKGKFIVKARKKHK